MKNIGLFLKYQGLKDWMLLFPESMKKIVESIFVFSLPWQIKSDFIKLEHYDPEYSKEIKEEYESQQDLS